MFLEETPGNELSDDVLINDHIERISRTGGGDLVLSARRYRIGTPIVLRSGVRLIGQGAFGTRLEATPSLDGPVVTSKESAALESADAWLASEGVPCRFGLRDFLIDGKEGKKGTAHGTGCGIYLYGKGFDVVGVQISNMQGHGLVSVGSKRGGQESWLDEPEAVFDVRISRCGGDGFLMRGPHDSIIRSAIISRCGGRGLAVETTAKTNGAVDIEYCHAYGTEGVAIDLQAKVKAGFLQADTGRGSGVRIGGGQMTFVNQIEVFKTRGSSEDYALDIAAPYTQIGLARVRADWGASGVRISSLGCQIGQLDINGSRQHTGGPLAGVDNDGVGLNIVASYNAVRSLNIRNFVAGYGIFLADKMTGNSFSGVTSNCRQHLVAEGQRGTIIRLSMLKREGQQHLATASTTDDFSLMDL